MSNAKFADGSVAGAICDRCRMSFKYSELSAYQFVPNSNLRVCNECNDPLNPYLLPPMQPDAIALRHPRPYVKLVAPQYINRPVYDGGPISTGDNVTQPPYVDPLDGEYFGYEPPVSPRRR